MILKTFDRLFTHDVVLSLDLLQRLTGREPDFRVKMGGWDIASTGDLLVMGGADEALDPIRDLKGPLVVADLDATQTLLEEAGAKIEQPIIPGPTGRQLFARHPDGTRMKYVQWNDDLVDRVIGKKVR